MAIPVRLFAFAGALVVLGAGLYALSQQRPDPNRDLFMGVDGDPRMRLCDTPANAELASPQVIAALGIGQPLVRSESQNGAYRISVLRPPGQESLSILFITPKAGASTLTLSTTTGGPATRVDVPVNYNRAANLVYALEAAGIWGNLRPTVETLVRAGEASAVFEVRAPRHDRCVTTRFDDERVRPSLKVFAEEIGKASPDLEVGGLVAPEPSFLPGVPRAN